MIPDPPTSRGQAASSDGPSVPGGPLMQAFLVELTNKPGALADGAEALAAKGINITAISGTSCGDGGRAAIMTSDEATTRTALDATGHKSPVMDGTERAP